MAEAESRKGGGTEEEGVSAEVAEGESGMAEGKGIYTCEAFKFGGYSACGEGGDV